MLPMTSLPQVAGAPSVAIQATAAPLHRPYSIMYISGLLLLLANLFHATASTVQVQAHC